MFTIIWSYGYVGLLARMYADNRVAVYAGTNEIMKIVIAPVV
jgi:alkylation response protein AidB-like acyl-CoA dehydrogenase